MAPPHMAVVLILGFACRKPRCRQARIASCLRQTIQFLKPHGCVVLVRLPVGRPLLQLEAVYQPGFEKLMRRTAADYAVPYLDYSAQPYATTDGNHLQKAASADFTRQLASDLKKALQERK